MEKEFSALRDWQQWTPDKIRATWDTKLVNRSWHQDAAYKFVAVNLAGSTVLDVGCGGGIQLAAFDDYVADWDEWYYAGLDVHPGMVEYCRQTWPDYDFLVADASEEIPYEDNEFDTVVVRHVLEHHPPEQAARLLAEVVRVADLRLLLLFFRPPTVGVNTVDIHRRRFYVNTYGERWLLDELHKHWPHLWLEKVRIWREDNPAARNDQELWIVSR